MKIGVPRCPTNSFFGVLVLFLFLAVTIVSSQGVKTPFGPVPANERPLLAKRLNAYTNSFRNKQWGKLYDFVSDANKNSPFNGKEQVNKHRFISAMQNTYEMRHLQKFTPVRTESGILGYDVYGCGEVPGRDETIVAIRAIWEHGNWFFTDWQYTDPWEACSHLSDSAWKPQMPLRLDGPMMELLCILNVCEI
ncbi:MAG TPA: hypothetical protein VN946_06160 [Terriglobales bacterium]|jgi:hypothetical protein|nr:hypothetical protein [Terriglobales bacterium]